MADKRKVEAGREKLAAYVKKKNASPPKKEKKIKKEALLDQPRASNSASAVLHSDVPEATTKSNDSMNSFNDCRDSERLSSRVKELEEIIAGKDAALAALREELDTSREMSVDLSAGMLSFGLEADYKTHLERYQTRLEEFEAAVLQRDDLIGQLSKGLQAANELHASKEEQAAQGIALLERQLQAATQMVQGYSWDTGINPHEYLTMQNKVFALEDSLNKNKSVIDELNVAILSKDQELLLMMDAASESKSTINELNTAIQAKNQELNQKVKEITEHKGKAAKEVQDLMRNVEELSQRCALSTSNISLDETALRHQLEEDFGLQLAQIKEELRNQLTQDYATELDAYKQQLEAYNAKCLQASAIEDKLTTDLACYEVELALQKEHSEEMKKKLIDLSEELVNSKQSHQIESSSYKQKIDELNREMKQAITLRAQIDTLKNNLVLAKENSVKELRQCQQSHIKELDLIKAQNATLEMELDNLTRDEGNCTAELNACKEAFIAQFGVNKHTAEMEVVSLRQQLIELTVKLKETSTLKSVSDLGSQQETFEKELKDLNIAKLNTLNETIERLSQQVQESMAAQETLTAENMGFLLQIDTYKEWLSERTKVEEGHGKDVLELQKELNSYKDQVEKVEEVEEKHSAAINALKEAHLEEIKKLNDQITVVVKNRDEYSNELILLRHEVQTLKKSLDEVVNDRVNIASELVACRAVVDNFKAQLNDSVVSNEKLQNSNISLQKLAEVCESELKVFKEQLDQVNDKHQSEMKEVLENCERDMNQVRNERKVELDILNQQVQELNKDLAMGLSLDEVSGVSVETEVLHDTLVILKGEINTLKKWIKCREESYGSLTSQLLDTVVKLESMQAMLRSKEELELSMQERDGELSQANESLKDVEALLEKRVKELEAALLEATVEKKSLMDKKLLLKRQLQESEALLVVANQDLESVQETLQETIAKLLTAEALNASKEDVETLFKTRIEELEGLLRQVNVGAMKAERDSMISQVVKSKEEIELLLRKRIEELEASLREVNIDSQAMKAESDRMTAQVSKARELLRRSKTERDELCKRYEGEIDQLKSQLKVRGGRTKTDNLEHLAAKLKKIEKEHEELESKCNAYEDEVQQLRGQLANSETSLEDLRQELSNNKAPAIDHIHQERRETISNNQLPVMGLSFMGNSFFNENNNSAFMNMSEYMGIAGVNSNNAIMLIENCNQLESVRHELETNVEYLRTKLREKELSEEFYREEIEVAGQRYKELRSSLVELKKSLETAERNIVSQSDLENRLIEMESTLKISLNVQENLRSELIAKQMVYEEKMHQTLREQLSESMIGGRNFEEIIHELSGKAKEVVVLSENLRALRENVDALNAKILVLEEGNQRHASQLALCNEETDKVRQQLEEAWQDHRSALDELGEVKRQLALTQLSKEHLENSEARRLSDAGNKSTLDAAKMALLQSTLAPPLSVPTTAATAVEETLLSESYDQDSLIDTSVSNLRGQLEHILNAGSDHNSTAANPTNLLAELSFYRQQHASLAEILGTTGVLQEALHRQKAELSQKLKDKAAVERVLECERVKLNNTELRLRLVEQQMSDRDDRCVELCRQKRLMEQDLREIEGRLSEHEAELSSQRNRLEAEIRDRDVRVRHWQMQYRAKKLELSHVSNVSRAPAIVLNQPDVRLDNVRRDLDSAHQQAVRRLKAHLHEVFAVRETELAARHDRQRVVEQEEHATQLAKLRQEFESKLHKLESTKLSDNQREKLDVDLEEIKIKLDEREKEIYSILQQKFELFAEQQVNKAVERIQNEHDLALLSQATFHNQELSTLQAQMEEKRHKELLAVQQELLEKYQRDLQETQLWFKDEVSRVKRTPSSYPTDSKSATQLLKQFICNEFTHSFQSLSKVGHAHYRQQLQDLTSQLEAAISDDVVVATVASNADQILDVQEDLISQTEALLETVVLEHSRMLEALGEHLDIGHSQLLTYLDQTVRDIDAAVTVAQLRDQVALLEQEKRQLDENHKLSVDQLTKDRDELAGKMEQLLAVAGIKCGPCVYLRKELEAKHKREMEELRQYFEQKCADVEKHYSEEIFSQHSRKLSTGSSSCENELVSDLCYPGGDHVQRANTLTHVCNTLDTSFKDVADECRRDYDQRLVEYRDQLELCKRDLEKKYRGEMEALRAEYEARVEQLVRDLTSSHQADMKQLEEKHSKDTENLRQQANNVDVEQVRQDLETAHAQQLAILKLTYEQKMSSDLESLTDRMLRDEAEHIELVKAQLNEEHAVELQRLLSDKVEAKQFAEASQCELYEKEEQYKRATIKQLQALLAEKDEGKFGAEYRKQLADLEAKHQAEIECERNHIAEQVEEYTNAIKMGAEQEQEKFMKVQKDIMSSFLLQHKQDVQLLTEQYEAQLSAARDEIRKLQSEHAEYDELITQSKRRLHAEVQHDVVQALDEQLQSLLSEDGDTTSCPPELMQLQDKFAARYKRELATLKQELAELRRQQSQPDVAGSSTLLHNVSQVSNDYGDVPVSKDRAELRQMAATMKALVCELAKYVTVCEDELNNTLVEQILKYDRDLTEPSIFRDAADTSSMSNGYGELPYVSIVSNLDVSSYKTSASTSNDITIDASDKEQSLMETPSNKSSSSSSRRKVRRVHFAPDMSNMLNMDEDNLIDYIDQHKALPDFRDELDTCLLRLKSEAAALLGANVSKTSSGDKSELSHHMSSEVSTHLSDHLETYKIECERLEAQVRSLAGDLAAARGRITELETHEDVTEGYGEQGHSSPVGRRIKNLADLQEQARSLLSEGGVKPPHLHLIEELCREGDRLVEESKQERDDLQLQVSLETPPTIVHRVCCLKVDAADKQLRSTRQFLEEQAVEREQERDEYTQQIARLQDQVKVNEGHRSDAHRHNKEVETLEVQVKEATSLLREAETKKEELEAELKAAVDKVWVLRDIISELESQVEIKSQNEAMLEQQLHELQALLVQQSQNNQELTQQLDAGQSEMSEQICQLEEQLRMHRQQMEQFQPDSVKQMKTTLRDFETTLDRKTKDLESLYTSTRSNASSPSASEEVSIREQIDVMRCATPDEAPPSLPLSQLLRLQDKLQVHSRAEQAALKKIRDLEMHIKTIQYEEHEVAAERDVLQSQVQEQLLKISLLQSNVEEQRSKADNIIQQASTELNKRLHDRELEARDLKQAVESREKQLADVQVVLEQTRVAVAAQEHEWTERVKKEQEVVQKLRKEYKKLKEDKKKEEEEKKKQEDTVEEDGAMGRYVPVGALIDTLQAAKNAQIDELTKQLADLEQQLEAYRQLDLTDEQKAQLGKLLKGVKSSKKALDDVKKKSIQPIVSTTTEVLYKRDELGDEADSSGAESDMDDSELKKLLLRKESQIISLKNQLADRMQKGLSGMRIEMDNKDQQISLLENQLAELPNLEAEIKSLRDQLKNTIVGVAQEKDQLQNLTKTESKLRTNVEAELQNERQLTKSLKDELNNLRLELNSLKGQGGGAASEMEKQVELHGAGGLSGLDLESILRKALEHGFESLSFDELSFLHERCCSSTARMILENPALKLAPMTFTLQGADKQQLCNRIACLEQEIARRQVDTQKKVCCLENTVKHEKRRLSEVKEALMRTIGQEQRRSLELHCRLGSQTQQQAEIESERDMLRRQLAYHEEKAKIAIHQLEKEKSKNRIMEEDLHKERNNIKHLQSLLEAERSRAKSSNLKESDLIETLRIKLETALDNEARMKFKYEKLEALYNSPLVPTNQSPRRPGATCQETCPAPCNRPTSRCNDSCPAPCNHHCPSRLSENYTEMQGKLEKERENAANLELSLRREQRKAEQVQALHDKEKQLSAQRIETEREKNKKLRRQMVTLEEEKESLNVQLDTGRETLSSQQVVLENLERKLLDVQETDERRRRRWTEEEEKNRLTLEKALTMQFELEQKVLDLQQEVTDLRDQLSAAGDLETMADLQRQLAESAEREQQLVMELAELPKETNVSAPLLQKLKRMNCILEKHVEENSEVAIAMTQLTLDRQKLQDRVRELETCLADKPDLTMFEANKMDFVNGLLASERSSWSREKATLLHALAKSESFKRSTDSSDADRVRHLFGKYMRSESYRKALVWQKRYLLVVINGYQDAEDKTVDRLAQIARLDMNSTILQDIRVTKNSVPINKFRSCCKAIIAIHRMQYLVQRWRHSRAVGSTAVLNRGSVDSMASGESSYYGPRRNATNVWAVPRGVSQLSQSPIREQYPSIDPSSFTRDQHMLRRWEMEQSQQQKFPETTSGLPPLQLSEYINRFDQIQQKLGLAVAHHPT